MKVLVTGASGFLGKFVMDELKSDHIVVGADLPDWDLRDDQMALALMEGFRPDAVVHLAARAGAEGFGGTVESRKNPYPYLKDNYLIALNILDAMKEFGVRRLVTTSSFSVYGKAPCPIDEETPLDPDSPYGASKVAVEILIRIYSRLYGIQPWVLRPTLLAGEGQREINVVRKFVAFALADTSLTVEGDGRFVRELIHPSDVAKAVSLCLKDDHPGTYVLGNDPISLNDMAGFIIRRLHAGRVTYVPNSGRGFDQFTDHSKALEVLGWKTNIPTLGVVDRVIMSMDADKKEQDRISKKIPKG